MAHTMTTVATGPVGTEAVLRDQLASFRALHVLAMVMTGTRDEDEVARLALAAVGSLSRMAAVGAHVDGSWSIVEGWGRPRDAASIERQLPALGLAGGEVVVAGQGWGWAYPLVGLAGAGDHLVVSGPSEPREHERFVLTVLAQQTGASVANARRHRQEQKGAEALRAANASLEQSMASLQRNVDIHERLTQVAVSGEGRDGIARAVHELTGYSIAIEDTYGNLGAWAGGGRPDPYPKEPTESRSDLLQRALHDSRCVRDRGRVLALARSGDEVLGVIALVDPGGQAGEPEMVALELGATVLAGELAHLRNLAESELRLRRDLVEDLLSGTEAESALNRARALGYDLERPHCVVVVKGVGRRDGPDELFHAVRRAARDTRAGSLLVARGPTVVLLGNLGTDWELLRAGVLAELGGGHCRLGVGGTCDQPADFPHSYRQALLALQLQESAGARDQATDFEELGIYRVLSEVPEGGMVDDFVERWLGPLLAYDAHRRARLVETLGAYLDCGGSYDATAEVLSLHRSTFRYRLQRIREVSGLDLGDPDVRFNLHVATRAWRTLEAIRRIAP
ncbi:MAG: sugar diacid utilization regulator [Acidimicrobiales bacterium]|nr:sugar diacid utilization regulator [Acidimicrobiales bacterium]